jgi:hypothetical protein
VSCAAAFPPQCPKDGCAAWLLNRLRAHGCKLYAVFGRDDGINWILEMPTLISAISANAHMPLTRAHEARLVMLLWAEVGGLN